MLSETVWCPVCFSRQSVPIVYGQPSASDVEAANDGEVHLGGRLLNRDAPNWHCSRCGYEWHGPFEMA